MIRTTVGQCRVGPTSESLRVQAKCFLICGIVFFAIGVALIIVAATTTTYIFGASVLLLLWGVICIFISWRKYQVAKWIDNSGVNGAVGAAVPGFGPATQINHPPTMVYQQPQQGFAAMPATQFSNTTVTTTTQYSPACPPYAAHGMYPTQGVPGHAAPPSYDEVAKTQ